MHISKGTSTGRCALLFSKSPLQRVQIKRLLLYGAALLSEILPTEILFQW